MDSSNTRNIITDTAYLEIFPSAMQMQVFRTVSLYQTVLCLQDKLVVGEGRGRSLHEITARIADKRDLPCVIAALRRQGWQVDSVTERCFGWHRFSITSGEERQAYVIAELLDLCRRWRATQYSEQGGMHWLNVDNIGPAISGVLRARIKALMLDDNTHDQWFGVRVIHYKQRLTFELICWPSPAPLR